MPVCLHASLLTVSNCHVCVCGGGDRERGETMGEINGGGRKREEGREKEREGETLLIHERPVIGYSFCDVLF